jgi:hypothetical protein
MKMTKYKVGDTVRVREDLNENAEYFSNGRKCGIGASSEMVNLRGSIVTIKSCPNSHEYYIEEDGGEWLWVDEMFSEKVFVVATTDIKTQEYMIEHQFELPRKYHSIAKNYPYVTWARAVELYERVVRDTLEEHCVSDILSGDLSFGRGLQKIDERFRLYLSFENDREFAAKKIAEKPKLTITAEELTISNCAIADDNGSFKKEFTSLWIPSGDCYNCSIKDCENCAYKYYKLAIT